MAAVRKPLCALASDAFPFGPLTFNPLPLAMRERDSVRASRVSFEKIDSF